MADVMSLFDSRFLAAYDLVDKDGRPKDYTLVIESVTGGELMTEGGNVQRKPVIKFKGAKKPYACNKTGAKVIISMYGRDHSKWPGRLLTLYPTTTKVGRDPAVPCIRIRPTIPKIGAGPIPDREPDQGELQRKVEAFASAKGEP